MWAAVIYGVAIVLAIVIPGAGDFWGMVIGAESEGINWVQESSNARLLVFAAMLLLLSPAGWSGALISFLVGTVLTIIGWWVLPADVWGVALPRLVRQQQRRDVLAAVDCDPGPLAGEVLGRPAQGTTRVQPRQALEQL